MAKTNGTRQNVADMFLAARNAPEHKSLTPSLDFGDSIRDLTNPQAAALAALLYEFETHPDVKNPARYLIQAAQEEL